MDGTLIKGANPTPAVVIHVRHWRFLPAIFPQDPPFQDGRDNIVPVSENIRLHHKIFTDDALNRVAAAID